MKQSPHSELFSSRLLHWFDQHGRHDLPWQYNKTLYRVWVSEIMLQQTQVKTVLPYYARFMRRFPDIQSLALAEQDEVLQHWAGLGYYARGRNLHKSAQYIMQQHQGQFPSTLDDVKALPGIGPSTAGAILSLALDQPHAILDGNVKRSLARYYGIHGVPSEKKTETKLWQLAQQNTPKTRNADYTQAIMDMGAMLCTRLSPTCSICPHQSTCVAYIQNKVSELPTKKPKKIKPKKHLYMLLLLDESHQASLFKRPDTGIWGGLYSLPEFKQKLDCEALFQNHNIDPAQIKTLGEDILHTFTHYHLRISPLYARLEAREINNIITATDNSHEATQFGVMFNSNTHQTLSLHDPALHGRPLTDLRLNLNQNKKTMPIGLPSPIQTLLETASKVII